VQFCSLLRHKQESFHTSSSPPPPQPHKGLDHFGYRGDDFWIRGRGSSLALKLFRFSLYLHYASQSRQHCTSPPFTKPHQDVWYPHLAPSLVSFPIPSGCLSLPTSRPIVLKSSLSSLQSHQRIPYSLHPTPPLHHLYNLISVSSISETELMVLVLEEGGTLVN
jgi:hypothetical protein